MNGIDISIYQKSLDLSIINFDFCIVKATEGKTYKDTCFEQHIKQALALDKCVGFYHFARPENNTAHDEVLNFLDSIRPYLGKGIPFLDWESIAKYNVTWAKQWLDEFYEFTGIRPLIYMSESVVNQYDWSRVAPNYGLWVARYRDNQPDYNFDMSNAGKKPTVKWWDHYQLWQWTSSGRLDGYNGNLDCNKFYGTKEDWDKLCRKEEIQPMPEYYYIEVENGVNSYSKSKVGSFFFTIDGRVSNFQVKEFACKDGTDEIKIDGALVRALQKCRDKFGVTTINSAYRTPEWNKKVGGVANSQHVQGKASDTVCKSVSPLELAMYAEAIDMGGVGLYNDFTHIDTRDGKARWDSRSGKEVGVSTFLKTVKLLSTGNEVRIAQKYLGAKVDGIFGPETRKLAIAFQSDHKDKNGNPLAVDGIVGPLTWIALLTR